MELYDIIIVGAGPAGLSAAIYAARAKLKVLVIDKSTAGGQVKTTHQVANYPGFIDPIPGHQLARQMHEQAKLYGAKFELVTEITAFDLQSDPKWFELEEEQRVEGKYVIIATGRSPRLLGIPGEQELKGNGISYCATCDADFFKGKEIFVIGGGNSAMEESLLLLQHVKSITVIHQFDTLQAEKITAEKVLSNPNVNVLWSHEPRAFTATDDGKITVEIENLKTHERSKLSRDGVFIFVGMLPNNELWKNSGLELDKYGYIMTNTRMQTNIPRVYAAGDITTKTQWQITTAVGDGTVAALEIVKSA
jgi:thioredoxin reductase (NADPH)